MEALAHDSRGSATDVRFDRCVGRSLDENELAENTVMMFLGDHGYELGVRNWWNENTLFERSCRTPLIARSKRFAANRRL